MKNLTGQRFGRLTVLYRTNEKKGSTYLWLCKCDCGKETMVSTYFLTHGIRKSCGCLATSPKVDLTGQIFDRLTVLNCTDKRAKGGFLWVCRCECGNTVFASTNSLTSGTRRSCGCLHIEQAKEQAYTRLRANNHIEGTNVGAIRSDNIPRNNTSGVRGVSWHRRVGKWAARITFKGQTISLGYFDDIADAAAARKTAEEKYFKKFLDDHLRS